MKPVLVTLPSHYAQRVGVEIGIRIVGAGETALLIEPLLGLISSRECRGHVLLETLDRVPEWVKSGRVIVSGFHSPLEQQVLRSVLPNSRFFAPPDAVPRRKSQEVLRRKTKRGLRRISGVGDHGVSQEPTAQSPAWCGALSA
jgi:hypothetical protein